MKAATAPLTLTGLSKSYGGVRAVDNVTLTIAPGEIVSLLGPSGCGKTTTLRMMAGLESPDDGQIRIGDKVVNNLPPWRRNIGMVFQSYALFPHMSVFDNVAFGLSIRGKDRKAIRAEVSEAMRLVRLTGFEDRRPSQLSGGQRQRVAFARAIVTKPLVLLLDEPLAALDKKLREQMQVEIKEMQRSVGITTVFVTHDQEEALALSDRIVVMEAGRIAQVGTPVEVYERPRTRFVSNFIGQTNAISASVVSLEGSSATVVTGSRNRPFTIKTPTQLQHGDPVQIVIRPEKIVLRAEASTEPAMAEGIIVGCIYIGAVSYYRVQVGSDEINAMVPNGCTSLERESWSTGTRVKLDWSLQDAMIFSDPTGRPNLN